MKILEPLVRSHPDHGSERRLTTFQDYVMAFGGHQYNLSSLAGSRPDVPDNTFTSYIDRIHRRNGVVAAAVETRALLLSQLRFKWRSLEASKQGDLFGNRDLAPLERPGGLETRPSLLHRLEVDASYAGAGYVARVNGVIRRLRPDHCSVVLGSQLDPEWDADDSVQLPPDAEVIGLLYHPSPKGQLDVAAAHVFLPGEFAIWAPEPDPVYFWRGTSWVTSVMREITADGQATDHQSKFFSNAATPNLVFIMDPSKTPAETTEFAAVTNRLHTGTGNAYRNMFLGGGTDVKVVGSTLESLNLKDMTGGFETRVALRSRIPGVILGVREGYAGSSLNAGNYNSARRMLADGWFTPTADSLCAALEGLLKVPAGAELYYDRSQVLFLQEDQQDAANILSTETAAMRTLVDGGFTPESVVDAISRGDLTRLVHSGKLSVQLQPPGEGNTDTDTTKE